MAWKAEISVVRINLNSSGKRNNGESAVCAHWLDASVCGQLTTARMYRNPYRMSARNDPET